MASDTFVKALSNSFLTFLVTVFLSLFSRHSLNTTSVTLQYQRDLTEEVFSSLCLGEDAFLKLPLFIDKFV